MSDGRARMAFGQGLSVWVLEAPNGFGTAEYHAHHAIQITVALEGQLRLATSELSLAGPALAVDADARHRIDAQGLLAFVFIEPESRSGRAIARTVFDGRELVSITDARVTAPLKDVRETFNRTLTNSQLLEVGRSVAQALAPAAAASPPDARVQRIIDHASAHLDEALTLGCAEAVGVHLSPSRLRHLFVEQTGLPFKTYVLWLRLVRAVQIYSEGEASLTQAAHAAGFADSAHFSRIFKRTFGSPATTLPRF